MTAENGKLPPHNCDAERCVLGSMLRSNAVIGDVLQIVREENFYTDAHRKIFRAIVDLYDSGKAVDLVTVANLLRDRGQFEDVQPAYLAELWDVAPTAAHAEDYARIVRDKAIVRRLIHASTDILRDAYDQVMPADELLEQAEKKILAIAEQGASGETVDLVDSIRAVYDAIDERAARQKAGGCRGLPTGYVDIDRRLAGLQQGELVIIAGRPGTGKTTLVMNVIRHILLETRQSVLFISLEQRHEELTERLLCCHAGVDSQKLRNGVPTEDEAQKLAAAGEELGIRGRLYMNSSAEQGMTRIAANARRYKSRHGIGLLVVDYLQLIETDNQKPRHEKPRHEQVSEMSRRLKILARELAIPVLVMSQLNRNSESRTDRRPRLSDLRESGGIEQDADVVLLLHNPSDPQDESRDAGASDSIEVIECTIAKNRNGPTGILSLAFRKACTRFENYAAD
jgi:replicative DNA helicase